jgi:hypothetical protein
MGGEWTPGATDRSPARLLDDADVNKLLGWLRETPADSWSSLATYFEVLA